MSLSERPHFPDGINAEFEEREKWLSDRGYDDTSERKTINPGLVLIKDDDHMYPISYYVEHKSRMIVFLHKDHESGIHIANWKIDYDDKKPLFLVGLLNVRDQLPSMHLGFSSRGVKSEKGGLSFPGLRAEYKYNGEDFEFDKIDSWEKSLTTGAKAEVKVQEEDGEITVNLTLNTGSVEEMVFPENFDYSWLERINDGYLLSLSDGSMPYLEWPKLLGVGFSLKSPFGNIDQTKTQ